VEKCYENVGSKKSTHVFLKHIAKAKAEAEAGYRWKVIG